MYLKKEKVLTSRVPTEEKFSDLIINKDEKTIGESTKPPGRPVGRERQGFKKSSQQITGYVLIFEYIFL